MTTESTKVQVAVQGDDIVVTLPGTSFSASYRMSPEMPQLLRSDWVRDDHTALITVQEFLVLAWGAANDKARELGWIV